MSNKGPLIYVPGKFAGVDSYSSGDAFRAPNFRKPGNAPEQLGARWDIVSDARTRDGGRGLSWEGVLGISVNSADGMNGDKSEMSVFFRHIKTGNWGCVVEGRALFLFAFAEYSTRAYGNRLDEFMYKSLALAGLDSGRGERKRFVRASEMIFQDIFHTLNDENAKQEVICAIGRAMEDAGVGNGNIDRADVIDLQTGEKKVYAEGLDGRISIRPA
ncbi:MAG: hypothetical protein ACR2PR_03815 [Pseudohongiellaceae bacterium]